VRLNMKTSRVALAITVITFFVVPSIAAPGQSPSAAFSAQQQSPSSSAPATTILTGKVQSGTTRTITAYTLST
jgi:hypothetical protein